MNPSPSDGVAVVLHPPLNSEIVNFTRRSAPKPLMALAFLGRCIAGLRAFTTKRGAPWLAASIASCGHRYVL